ncbi:uncharacterized protein LOC117253759 [Epinephelus lanceolatus]
MSSTCVFTQQVVAAINDTLNPQYLHKPSAAEVQEIVRGFSDRWGFPQCAGAVDGTHICILATSHNPADYYNRKGFYSAFLYYRYYFLLSDGKTWWRQEVSTSQHHLKNWKVMLWVMASLLTLVKDVFSEDNKEAHPDLQRVQRQPFLSPAEDLEQDSSVHAPWPQALEEWSLMQDEEIQQSRWRRSPPVSSLPRTSRRSRKKTKSIHDCHLERKEIRVRDLDLGYNSDEIVLFKYCVGTCHSSRKNYDLALKVLMDKGSVSGKMVSSHPCCRPTHYETVSFMDTQTTWQTIRWLSAANCSCVG